MRSICLGVAMLMGSAIGAYAQEVETRVIVSGPGGVPGDDICHGSDVLIGFNYTAGSTLNSIAGVCQAQNNGVLFGANYGLFTRGTPRTSGGVFPTFGIGGTPRCPAAMAIGGEMHVALDKNGEVQHIDATCVGLLPNQHLQPVFLSALTDGTAVSGKNIACEPGRIANGLVSQSGPLINGVGMQCAIFPWSVAAASITPPNPTPHYVKVIVENADVYSDCTGQTTIGHISKETSDQVVLKKLTDGSCNPEYYDLSWPGAPAQDNWVFSAPQGSADGPTQLDPTTLAAAIAALKNGH
jgi:hypothetical protein